jgi:hypothetical protein
MARRRSPRLLGIDTVVGMAPADGLDVLIIR